MRIHRQVDRVVVPRLGRIFAAFLGAGRWRLRLFTVLGLTCCAAMLVTVVWASRGRAPETGTESAGPMVHVGVGQGQTIPQYLMSSHEELKVLLGRPNPGSNETYALVSLRSYLAPDRLTPVLGGVAVAEVYARVPTVEAQTQTQIVRIPAERIPQDVVSGMLIVASRKDAEAGDFRTLAAQLRQVDAAEERLRQNYLGGASVAAHEASAYRSGCACVYAAVVRATPAALDEIAARPEVWAVDPAPEVVRIDQAVFLAPLPEQKGIPRPAQSASVRSPSPASWPARRRDGVR